MANPIRALFHHLKLNGNNLIDVGNINCGVTAISTSLTIDPTVYKHVIVTVPTLTSITVTINASTARTGMEVYVKRANNLSVGTLTIATTTGNIQNPGSNIVTGILSFALGASYNQVGWVYDGTNWLVISAS